MNRILIVLFWLPALAACGQAAVDTISLWNYQLENRSRTEKDKSIALITFWRTRPINDSVYIARHQESWTPQISFSVYPLSDSVHCKEQNSRIKSSSTCLGPDIGGDMYRVGSFILLNREICLSCLAYSSKQDFCRPVINKLMGAIDNKNVKTLKDLEAQLGVKKGDRYK